jgi:hypothetical protein
MQKGGVKSMDKCKYILGDIAKGKFYATTAQSKGAILWWVINCELMTHVSGGNDYHAQIVKGAKINRIYRGRATKSIGGTLTIMPPIEFFSNKENWVNVPDYVLLPLIRRFEPKEILVEMGDRAGMRVLNVIEAK